MGLSSSKTKTTQDQNTTQSGTTMPITPDWLTQAAEDYVGRIGDFGQMDPTRFIAGASPLQQQAWNNTDQLGGWRPQANTAANLALGVGTSGPNLAGKYGRPQVARGPAQTMFKPEPMSAPQVAQGPAPQVAQEPAPLMSKGNPMAGPQIAAGPQPQAAKGVPGRVSEGPGFLPQGGQGLVSAQGYSAAPSNPGYAMPRTGQPIGYTPPADDNPAITSQNVSAGPSAWADPYFADPAVTGASQANNYFNPYQQQVIDTTLAGFDRNRGVQEARMDAEAARNGAFGGSRFGVMQGQYAADTDLSRAGLDANLRSQGFELANQFGMQDANAMNAMNQFNAGQGNMMGQFNAGSANDMSRFNAGQATANNQFNAGAGNQMLQFDAQQQDNAATRGLAASQLLMQGANDYGAGTRADLGTMSALGDQQRGIEQAYAASPLAQLEAIGSLSGMTPYQILVGNQVDTTGQSHGTSVTKSSQPLFNQLLALGSLGASAATGGLFGGIK